RADPRAFRDLSLGVAGGLLAAGAVVGQAALLSRVLGGVFVEHRVLRDLGWTLAALLVLALLRGAGLVAGELLGQRASGPTEAALRCRLGSRLLELGPIAMRGERTGEVATTVVERVD